MAASHPGGDAHPLVHELSVALGVPDAELPGEIISRAKALYRGVLGSHIVEVHPASGADRCGACGADIEDALTDGLICPGKQP